MEELLGLACPLRKNMLTHVRVNMCKCVVVEIQLVFIYLPLP